MKAFSKKKKTTNESPKLKTANFSAQKNKIKQNKINKEIKKKNSKWNMICNEGFFTIFGESKAARAEEGCCKNHCQDQNQLMHFHFFSQMGSCYAPSHCTMSVHTQLERWEAVMTTVPGRGAMIVWTTIDKSNYYLKH